MFKIPVCLLTLNREGGYRAKTEGGQGDSDEKSEELEESKSCPRWVVTVPLLCHRPYQTRRSSTRAV